MPICPHCKMEYPAGASKCGHCREMVGTAGTIQAVGALVVAGLMVYWLWPVLRALVK